MDFNHKINRIKLWCGDKSRYYSNKYNSFDDIYYLCHCFAEHFKQSLSMIMDRDFQSVESFRQYLFDKIRWHAEDLQRNFKGEGEFPQQLCKEAQDVVDEVINDPSHHPEADIPYFRIIHGDEVGVLCKRFGEAWGFDKENRWFPIDYSSKQRNTDELFIMSEYLTPYLEELSKIVSTPQNRMYKFEESVFGLPLCLEVEAYFEDKAFEGEEIVYSDKAFNWHIYLGKMNLVKFAGSIVPSVKELLIKEKEQWNQYERN